MIYTVTELPVRYALGTEIDTRLQMWARYPIDEFLGICGNRFEITRPIWKYKTIEYYPEVGIERILIAFDELNLSSFSNKTNDPLDLFVVHTKCYSRCPKTGHRRSDVFRCMPAIQKILEGLGDTTASALTARPDMMNERIRSVSEPVPQPLPNWRYTHIVPNGFCSPSELDWRLYESSGQLPAHHASVLLKRGGYFKDPLLRHYASTGILSSTTLKRYLHPSYTARRYTTKLIAAGQPIEFTEKHIFTIDTVNELRTCLVQLATGLQESAYTDIQIRTPSTKGHQYFGDIVYACNTDFPSFVSGRRNRYSFLSPDCIFNLRRLMELHDATKAIATKTWSDEVFITITTPHATIEFYIDLSLYCGLGSEIIIQPTTGD